MAVRVKKHATPKVQADELALEEAQKNSAEGNTYCLTWHPVDHIDLGGFTAGHVMAPWFTVP